MLLPAGAAGHRYNLQIDYGKQHMSGLLVIRRQQSGVWLLAGVTHFGLSLFQFTLDNGQWTTHSCIDPLASPKVLALLQRDFGLLLQPDHYKIRRCRKNHVPCWTVGRGLGRTVWRVQQGMDGIASGAVLQHPWLRLTLRLDPLQ